MKDEHVSARLARQRFRAKLRVFALVVISGMQGCAAPLTYLSPQLTRDAHYPSAIQIIKGYGEPFPGTEGYCDHTLRGATHQALAISIDNYIGACFSSPTKDLPHEIAGNPGVLFANVCQRGRLMRPDESSGKLIFSVFIGSTRGELAVVRSRGELEVDRQSITAITTVQSRDFLDMPEAEIISGRMVYDVDGKWLTFRDAAPHYTRKGYQVLYSFDRSCDPDQHYRLTISGITLDGREVAVPPIDFIPFTDSAIRFD